MIIVGGGIFGLSIGWYLARKGHPVTLVEQHTVGAGASWAAAGMLMPWKLSATFSDALFVLQQESHRLWPVFVEQLMPYTTSPAGLSYRGSLFCGAVSKGGRADAQAV
jgi:glycine oxidase